MAASSPVKDFKKQGESFSSYNKSIITLAILEDDKRSTCSSLDSSDEASVEILNTNSMITISSWHTKRPKSSFQDNLIAKPCSCLLF